MRWIKLEQVAKKILEALMNGLKPEHGDFSSSSLARARTLLRKLGCIAGEGDYITPGVNFDLCLRLFGLKSDEQGELREVRLLLSDIHLGRKTETFNLGVLRIRIRKLIAELSSLTSGGARLLVFGLGDYVDGAGIYGRQAYEQEIDPSDQVVEFTNVFAELFEMADSVYAVIGNHGRTDENESASFDYIALKSALSGKRNAYVSKRYVDVFNVGGEQVLLGHVSHVRAYHGIPDYGIRRFLYSQLARWRGLGEAYLGHFHVFKYSSEPVAWVSNGTFLDNDELSYRMGFTCDVGQAVVLIEDNKKWTGFINLGGAGVADR
ncbi:metallophosphoesterase [Thermofilum sp.]|uniref:metallophosphoesterase n=1 Tax=Thermofilum sp. TaxID=1961369 RepID=UPI003161A2E9